MVDVPLLSTADRAQVGGECGWRSRPSSRSSRSRTSWGRATSSFPSASRSSPSPTDRRARPRTRTGEPTDADRHPLGHAGLLCKPGPCQAMRQPLPAACSLGIQPCVTRYPLRAPCPAQHACPMRASQASPCSRATLARAPSSATPLGLLPPCSHSPPSPCCLALFILSLPPPPSSSLSLPLHFPLALAFPLSQHPLLSS